MIARKRKRWAFIKWTVDVSRNWQKVKFTVGKLSEKKINLHIAARLQKKRRITIVSKAISIIFSICCVQLPAILCQNKRNISSPIKRMEKNKYYRISGVDVIRIRCLFRCLLCSVCCLSLNEHKTQSAIKWMVNFRACPHFFSRKKAFIIEGEKLKLNASPVATAVKKLVEARKRSHGSAWIWKNSFYSVL